MGDSVYGTSDPQVALAERAPKASSAAKPTAQELQLSWAAGGCDAILSFRFDWFCRESCSDIGLGFTPKFYMHFSGESEASG